MVKKGVRPCVHCNQEVDLDNSKYVLLGTYNGKDILEEGYYHFNCFVKWYNSKVTEKATNTIKSASGIAGKMLKKVMVMGKESSEGNEIIDLVEGELPNMEEEIPQ